MGYMRSHVSCVKPVTPTGGLAYIVGVYPVAQDVVVLVHFHQVSLFRDEIPRVALEGTDAMDLGALRQAEDFQFKPPIVRLVGVAEFDSLRRFDLASSSATAWTASL